MLNTIMENENKHFVYNETDCPNWDTFFPKFKVYVRNIQIKEIIPCYQNLR